KEEKVDYAVLSHAHYDHANGIPGFMAHNAKAKWYVREATAEDCYFKKFIFRKYIGIPKGMEEQYPARIEKISGTYRLTEGVHLIPHTTKGRDASV
ncbi:MAG: MBL fold metallo-hydrolase, partial [Lachnospiraceae bacterium]|nr:MBL fold metallo-hydrolase [Lachnospiraceae bacterium]